MLLGGSGAHNLTPSVDGLREGRIGRLARFATDAYEHGDRIRARLLLVFMAQEIGSRSEAQVMQMEIRQGLRS